MNASQQTAAKILEIGKSPVEAFTLRKGMLPQWSDATQHEEAYQQNPELYALGAVAPTISTLQQVRILFQLLRVSRQGMTVEVRQICDRVVKFLLAILHPDEIIKVFLALRRERANHKHTAKTILKYILNHPDLEDMAICRRPALVDCLEHAMGRNVSRACAKMLTYPELANTSYLHRHLFKFAENVEKVKIIFPTLYQKGNKNNSNGEYKLTHTKFLEKLTNQQERPKTITATNRGDISATLVHLYRGGISGELQEALNRYVDTAAKDLPQFHGKLALVLDASASTRGYGEREYCCISQSVALKLVLEKCCPNLTVYSIGGKGKIPFPEGETDLATALLDALETQPDIVAIVSDGYENIHAGDLAKVVVSLPQIGIKTPIIFCHSKFTNSDDLTLRRPAENLPQLEFWHQDDFTQIFMTLFALSNSGLSEFNLREFLLKKLEATEQILSIDNV